MSLKTKLLKAVNEKDVENIYRAELLSNIEANITSPYNIDGLLTSKNVRTLLEFKYNESFKNKLNQSNVLLQCLYYLKKFENAGEKLPTTIFVGDINECFAIHTNSIVKYLSSEIDWKIAASQAYKSNSDVIQAMVDDVDILPFVYDVDDNFHIKTIIEKIKEFSDNIIRKVRVTRHNIVAIFDYFDKNVLDKISLSTNEKANLFIQIIINPNENYLHPKKKNILITKSFGELTVNQNLFNSFFQHFEGDIYSPKEKEGLTALIDRLVDDTVRRSKGEFFTPTPFVDLAHKYISETFGDDWKDKYIVWDCCCGSGNLTRDYNFKQLYLSTLEQSDLDTINQMDYNQNSSKFQFDFLNDDDSKLPISLQDSISNGKEILFLINPPYATENNLDNIKSLGKSIKEDIQNNNINKSMNIDKNWGKSSKNLYTQFLYKIFKYQQLNENVKICIFSPPLFLSGQSFKQFRKQFFTKFNFKKGFLFEASHFSDIQSDWGITFTILDNKENVNNSEFNFDIVCYNNTFELEKNQQKTIYNNDINLSCRDWLYNIKNNNTKINVLTLKSSLSIKEVCGIENDYIGGFLNSGNNVYFNQRECFIGSTRMMSGNNRSNTINKENFLQTTTLFTARKTIQPNWINCKDEYLAPNIYHPLYEQFTYDSIIYSLFNNSSQQSSLRNVDYKDKKWNVKNEFFWMSKNEMMKLANENNYDELYVDAKNSAEDRFVYNKLFVEGVYEKLSDDAKELVDIASELVRKSIKMRKIFSESHPEYHLNSFDCGYAQLKLITKEYFKTEHNIFRDKYKSFENRLIPLVYELEFLKNVTIQL